MAALPTQPRRPLFCGGRSDRLPAEPAAAGAPRQLTELELATRLAFFLWSSPPDEELIGLAKRGELRKPGFLTQQIECLLADEPSERFTNSFVAQWLGLARLDFFQFNAKRYRDFDLTTKAASKEEVFETFLDLLKKHASRSQLLRSNSVFINGLLANPGGRRRRVPRGKPPRGVAPGRASEYGRHPRHGQQR